MRPNGEHAPYLYFSYAQDDAREALDAAARLEAQGCRIRQAIHADEAAQDEALQHAAGCLLLLTPSAVFDHDCRRAMTLTLELERPLIVLLPYDFMPTPGVREQLRRAVVSNDTEHFCQAALGAAPEAFGTAAPAEQAPAQPAEPVPLVQLPPVMREALDRAAAAPSEAFGQQEDPDAAVTVLDDDPSGCSRTVMEQPDGLPLLVWLEARKFYNGRSTLTSVGRNRRVCDLVFQAPTIGGHHADILVHGGQTLLLDCSSKNGTYVNGIRLEPGAQAEIRGYAEVRLSYSQLFLLAEGAYAQWIRTHRMLASLTSVNTEGTLWLFGTEQILGRSYPWACGAMRDRSIGRHHAVLHPEVDGWHLEDQSQNGTFRTENGREVRLPKAASVLLHDGDRLRLGKEQFVYRQYDLQEGETV